MNALKLVTKPQKLTKTQKLENELAQTQAALKTFEEEKAKQDAKTTIVRNLEDAFGVTIPRSVLLVIGMGFGAFIPSAAFWFAHHEVQPGNWVQTPVLVILGCLIYSSLTVYQWMKEFTGFASKAIGFVVALEVVMITTKAPWLMYWALGLLVFVNAVVGASNMAVKK